jgi:uncharacterized membrane protein YoaK (UPF0700 family)
MPLAYMRQLTGRKRTDSANRHLAYFLAFIAGAANAGGLSAVGQYTSHMSGIISTMANSLARGNVNLVLNGLGASGSFLAGASLTTIMVRWARARDLDSEYALPLMLEAALLVVFGLTGRIYVPGHLFVKTVMLLCFTMGLQNALITHISNAVIRTTHVTGMVTDMGISLGRLAVALPRLEERDIESDVKKLRLHGSLVGLFFAGGFTGTLGFKYVGFLFTLPLALILAVLAAMPVIDDVVRQTDLAA